MPEYFIQKKYLGTNARTLVRDSSGNPKYLLVGTWGVKGDVLSIYTMDGALLANVKKQIRLTGTTFDLYEDLKKVGTMRKVLHLHFDFYYIPQLNWQIVGNIYQHRYSIRTFSKKIMEMNDTWKQGDLCYQIDITNESDAPLVLCVASVLDYWLYNNQKSQRKKLKFKPSYSLNNG